MKLPRARRAACRPSLALDPLALAPFALAMVLLALPPAAHGQDRRDVREPSLPTQICATLAPKGALADAAAAQGDGPALQAAINACPAGSAVHLTSGAQGGRFVAGPLALKSGVALWLDAGVVLAATTDPAAYDITPGACGMLDASGRGCRPFITLRDTRGGGFYGDGAIDGQGGQIIKGARSGRAETWWQLARRAQAENSRQNVPRLIQINTARDLTFYRITLRNSPNFHVAMDGVRGATFWGVKVDAPADARNTDGIDPGASEDITIAHSFIRTGDDNVAIKAGNSGATHHISITDNHFYWGHGMSIGSETNGGVHDILVRGLTLDGTTSGIRIKSDVSRGGLVERVLYEDVCLRDNRWAVYMDTSYGKQAHGDKVPTYRAITLRGVSGGTGKLVVHGVDDAHKLGVLLDGVRFAADARWDIDHADVSTADTASPPDCGGRFVAFAQAPASAYTVGAGQRFATVQAALDAAPEGATIAIYPGTYREVVRMTKPGQRLVGLGATREDVVIEEAQSAGTSGGTGKSATLFAQADGVSLAHLTIANRFHWEHPEVKDGAQALALSTTGDRQSFSDLHLIGFQDTLFAGSHGCAADKPCLPSRQIFADSRIDGAVDFVFGDALAWFERVELHALGRDNVLLTAQGRRELRQPSGYVFHACTVSAQEPVKQISLGRPWRDYATVFFVGCTLDDKVLPAGFTEWNDLNRLPTARYAIWDARGPGAAKGPREPFLLSAQAKADAHVASAADFFAHPPQ